MKNVKFRIIDIIRGTTVDGPGFRTSIYLAGCNHHCQGCHNPQTWDFNNGTETELSEILDIVEEEDFNVTLTGGDPLYNPETTRILIHEIKRNRRNVWVYTGYTWEEITASPLLLSAIQEADVVVDGKFQEEMKNTDLPFRGSENQRIIDIQKSLSSNLVVLFQA